MVFPYLCHDILLNSSHEETYRELMSEQIQRLFRSHVNSSKNHSRASTPLITKNENGALDTGICENE